MRLYNVVLLTIGLATANSVSAAEDRAVVWLDGKWQGRMDQEKRGEKEQWFSPRMQFKDKANVPGCWDNDGFGTSHEKARTNFNGRFWYKRNVRIPAEWRWKRVFLCVGGTHRTSRTWVNDRYLGEHVGYLLAFEYDITRQAAPGQEATIAIEVDSTHRPEIDPLHGEGDIVDYMGGGYGKQAKESGDLNAGDTDVTWGGIWGHVKLEVRADAWVGDLFAQPCLSPPGTKVQARVEGDLLKAGADGVRLEILDRDGRLVAIRHCGLGEVLAGRLLTIATPIVDGQPWSFRTPYLYTARAVVAERRNARRPRFHRIRTSRDQDTRSALSSQRQGHFSQRIRR